MAVAEKEREGGVEGEGEGGRRDAVLRRIGAAHAAAAEAVLRGMEGAEGASIVAFEEEVRCQGEHSRESRTGRPAQQQCSGFGYVVLSLFARPEAVVCVMACYNSRSVLSPGACPLQRGG